MDSGLETALIFLVYTSIIVLVLLAVFIGKLLYDLSDLMKSANSLLDVINSEIEPTLAELRKTLDSINSIASSADRNVTALKNSVGKAFDVAFNATSKLKGFVTTLIGGIWAGAKVLSSKKK